MLEIILFILKTAGIILALFLGILIVLIILALFFSVRYKGDFSASDAEEGEEKKIDSKICMRVKYLFFTLWDTEKRKDKKKKKRKKKGKRQSADPMEEDVSGEPDKRKEMSSSERDSREEPSDTAEDSSASYREKDVKSGNSNILQTIRDFCDKLKGMKDKTARAQELWTSDHMVKSRNLLGKELVYLLRHAKPKKLSGYLRFGFDDPSITGYVMALYGVLYPMWNPKLSVEPDFEKQVIDCHVLIRGKVRVWHLARVALKLLLSRDVRRVIKEVRKT